MHTKIPNTGAANLGIRDSIIATFKQVAADNRRTLAPLTDDLKITECGLDSLCFAVIVSILEDSVGKDPFSSTEFEFPTTFGEFVSMYDRAVAT
jgi:acyl carrier protein